MTTNTANNVNLLKIIKRLVLIKNLIALEEEEDILEQIPKLEELDLNEQIKEIINLLKQKAFGKAIKNIEEFLKFNNEVTFYIDPEIEALRFEAKAIERQIQKLSYEKAELEKIIHEFSVRHNQELGEIIIKILRYRKEQTKCTPQEEEAKKDYTDFFSNYESTKNDTVSTLNEEEQKELKSKYRKASKLCHPDLVDEDQKENAHIIFMELNKAYERNDLKRVSEILDDLLKGKSFTSKSDTSNEKIVLEVELKRLHLLVQELLEAIKIIKTSETFETIVRIADWNEYFSNTKQQLEKQLLELENER